MQLVGGYMHLQLTYIQLAVFELLMGTRVGVKNRMVAKWLFENFEYICLMVVLICDLLACHSISPNPHRILPVMLLPPETPWTGGRQERKALAVQILNCF